MLDHTTPIPRKKQVAWPHSLLKGSTELISSRLFFLSTNVDILLSPAEQSKLVHFSVEQHACYSAFRDDFGPFNLGQTHRFIKKLTNLLSGSNVVLVTCGKSRETLTNAVTVLSCFLVAYQRLTAQEAIARFSSHADLVLNFRDALEATQQEAIEDAFELKPLHVVRAFQKALHSQRWYDPLTFDVLDYEYYEAVEHGDLNLIVPGRFVAFASPAATGQYFPTNGRLYQLGPVEILPTLRKFGIGMIIRLNDKIYDETFFVRNQIAHRELFFHDGESPPESIINSFFQIVDSQPGVIAVHCKAGIGRAGTLLALSLMRYYRFTAQEAIGWMRLTRPGSVIGHQKQCVFLHQAAMHAWYDSSKPPQPTAALSASQRLQARFNHIMNTAADVAPYEFSSTTSKDTTLQSRTTCATLNSTPPQSKRSSNTLRTARNATSSAISQHNWK